MKQVQVLNKHRDSQRVYMRLKKTELLGSSDYDRIFKIHVYTLVWLKSDRIGFLRSAQVRDFFPRSVSRK